MYSLATVADCGGLDSPTNGIVVFSGTTFGSQANYSCNSLHRLVGPNSRECTEEGVWSDTAPTCIGQYCLCVNVSAGYSLESIQIISCVSLDLAKYLTFLVNILITTKPFVGHFSF